MAAVMAYNSVLRPRTMTAPEPGADQNETWVTKESYRESLLFKSWFLFFGAGIFWTGYGLPHGISATIPFGVPFLVLGASGLYDAFFRVQHTFHLEQQRVVVDIRGLVSEKYEYSYADLRIGLEGRGRFGGASPTYWTVLHYPGAKILLGCPSDYDDALVDFGQYVRQLKIPESQQNPPATKPRTWF